MSAPARERLLLNVGSGARDNSGVPGYFDSWHQLRLDVDPAVQPDIIADLTDLSVIADAAVDAIWASHCIEHLYAHQVIVALQEFRRVLRPDGFACVIVPDLQAVAQYVAADTMHEALYQSAAGPITPHDIFFGFGAAIANGQTWMAHRSGFTPGMLQHCFKQVRFGEVLLRRRAAALELVAVARATAAKDETERAALMDSLGL